MVMHGWMEQYSSGRIRMSIVPEHRWKLATAVLTGNPGSPGTPSGPCNTPRTKSSQSQKYCAPAATVPQEGQAWSQGHCFSGPCPRSKLISTQCESLSHFVEGHAEDWEGKCHQVTQLVKDGGRDYPQSLTGSCCSHDMLIN